MEYLTRLVEQLAVKGGTLHADLGLGSVDMPWFVYAAVALALLIHLFLKVRGRRDTGGTLRDLGIHAQELASKGVEEWKRPFELLTERREWRLLPEDFLWELVSRFGESRATIDFVTFVEANRPVADRLGKIARSRPSEDALKEVATMLLAFGRKNKKHGRTALAFAMAVEPKNPEVLLGVAAERFGAKQYDDAMPLFEAGIQLCQQRIETLQAWPNPDQSVEKRTDELQILLKVSTEMYLNCMDNSGPAPKQAVAG